MDSGAEREKEGMRRRERGRNRADNVSLMIWLCSHFLPFFPNDLLGAAAHHMTIVIMKGVQLELQGLGYQFVIRSTRHSEMKVLCDRLLRLSDCENA